VKLKLNIKRILINTNVIGILMTLLLSSFDEQYKTFQIGTMLILISAVLNLFINKKRHKFYDGYFFLMIFFMTLGSIIFLIYLFSNSFFSFPNYTFGVDMMKSTVRAKIALALVLLNAYSFSTRLDNKEKHYYLDRFYILSSIIVVIIFFTNFENLLDIWETPKRLNGFSTRPTQLASVLSVTFFLGFDTYNRRRIKKRYFYFFLIITIIVSILTESEALLLSIVISLIILALYRITIYFIKRNKKVAHKFIASIIFYGLLITPIVLFFLIRVFDADRDQASGRFNIWWNSIRATSYSPIFGFGPGSYSGTKGVPFIGKEAHNTILDLLGYGGVFLLFLITYIYYKIINKLTVNNFLVLALVSITVYGMFHNNGRTPYYWLLLFFLLDVKKQEIKKINNVWN